MMAAAAKLPGDLVDVDVVALERKADAGHLWLDFFKTQATTTGSMARMWSIRPSLSVASAPVRR